MKIRCVFKAEKKEEKNRVQTLKLSFTKPDDRPTFEKEFSTAVDSLKK